MRCKTNEVSPLVAPVCCRERVSRLQQRKGVQWSPADSLSQGHGAENLGRAHRTEDQTGDLSRVFSGNQSPYQHV